MIGKNMAASNSTFAERLARINSGKTVKAASLPKLPKRKAYRKGNRFAMPLLVCAALVGSTAAYAWVDGSINVERVLAMAY
jgi:hypothetical protein